MKSHWIKNPSPKPKAVKPHIRLAQVEVKAEVFVCGQRGTVFPDYAHGDD